MTSDPSAEHIGRAVLNKRLLELHGPQVRKGQTGVGAHCTSA